MRQLSTARTAIDETHWQEISYTYDKKGRMLSVTDPMGGQTFVSYEKDGVGMASYQTAEGYVWSYAYDPAGRCMLVQGEESRLTMPKSHGLSRACDRCARTHDEIPL